MLHVFDARAILVGVKHDIVVLGEGVDGHRLQTTRQPFRSMRGRVEAVHEALCAHQGAFLTGRTHVDLVPSVLGADEAMLFDVPLPEHLTEFIVLLHSEPCELSQPLRPDALGVGECLDGRPVPVARDDYGRPKHGAGCSRRNGMRMGQFIDRRGDRCDRGLG